VESKCGILDTFLSLESCRHLGLHRSHQKRGPFEFTLSTLFLGFSKTYSGFIAVDLNLIFGIENWVADLGFLGDRYFNFKPC
jgi:hypothetical protein